ncbi:MAG: hypothetical protein GEEBNDBF_01636 [bacterium]|nr:hypothetical protein [bacterium]
MISPWTRRLPSTLLLLGLAALLLINTACPGGDRKVTDPPIPVPVPMILRILPKLPVVPVGGQVTLLMETGGITPDEFRWEVPDGVSLVGTSTSRPVLLGRSQGWHRLKVRACHQGNCSLPAAVVVRVYGTAEPVPGQPAGGGGDPPVILSVEPSGIWGEVGFQVTLNAQTSGLVTDYLWIFNGGVIPDRSTETSPSLLLDVTGMYEGELVVTGPNGPSEPFPFAYEILAAPPGPAPTDPPTVSGILGLQPSICDNKPIHLQANSTGERISQWVWTFEGGVEPRITTNSVARVRTTTPGTYTGSLTVRNALGDAPPVPFSFKVEDCPDLKSLEQAGAPYLPRGVVAYITDPAFAYDSIKAPGQRSFAFLGHPDAALPGPSDTITVSAALFAFQGGWDSWPWGAGDWITKTFDATVPLPIPGWQRVFEQEYGYSSDPAVDIRLIGDRIWVAVFDSYLGARYFLEGRTPNPVGESDWTRHDFNVPSGTETWRMQLHAAGNLPLLVLSGSKQITVIAPANDTPTTTSDWVAWRAPDLGKFTFSLVMSAMTSEPRLVIACLPEADGRPRLFQAQTLVPRTADDWGLIEPALPDGEVIAYQFGQREHLGLFLVRYADLSAQALVSDLTGEQPLAPWTSIAQPFPFQSHWDVWIGGFPHGWYISDVPRESSQTDPTHLWHAAALVPERADDWQRMTEIRLPRRALQWLDLGDGPAIGTSAWESLLHLPWRIPHPYGEDWQTVGIWATKNTHYVGGYSDAQPGAFAVTPTAVWNVTFDNGPSYGNDQLVIHRMDRFW